MSAVPSSSSVSPFELRNATLALVALILKTTDLELLSQALEERFGQTPLFDHDPVVLDLAQVASDPEPIDFVVLSALLRQRRMLAVGVEGGSAAQLEAALAAGLGEASTFATAPRTDAVSRAEVREPPPAVRAAGASEVRPTLVIERPLRSGQQVYAKGGDLVVLGAVSFGAEVIADGSIHVYAPLRGRAIAGARGNTAARIYASCMEPQLAAIAGTYRTTDIALPGDVWGKPAQVRLDGAQLVVEPLKF